MNIFFDANVQYVLAGCMLFGLASGVLGCFAFLRRRALLGDAIAHAALPGVCLAYLVTQNKHPAVFIVGAAVTGLAGSFAVNGISRWSRIKEDAAIGIVLSVFFGFGIMLLTYIQHQPFGNQSGLDKFLFGQAASLVGKDVQVFAILTFILLVGVVFFYKEFKVIAFDRTFAEVIGIPIGWMDAALTLLIVLVVTTGLQAVGVVLMAAMLITPAAAARQWTQRLATMLLLAGLFGALAGAAGAIASTLAPRMPTGPWIVIAVTAFFAVSIAFAPQRGMLARWWRHRQQSMRVNLENILRTLYRLREEEGDAAFSLDQIRRFRHLSVRQMLHFLGMLKRQGLVEPQAQPDRWRLTALGVTRAAELVRRHRLWEVYLSRYLHLDSHHVHADAEEMEHIITPEIEAELEHLLAHPRRDPHDQPIPVGSGGPR
ncbi:MAG: metal ABC transporter permease [Deltaproteobacteria bacterium]|nr:metal ABC transporter permease [Deltaproteobacteria bacterium]